MVKVKITPPTFIYVGGAFMKYYLRKLLTKRYNRMQVIFTLFQVKLLSSLNFVLMTNLYIMKN